MNNLLLMTQKEFAGHRGVLPSAVSNWKKNGLLVWAEGPTGKLMIDVEKTDARLNTRVNQMRGRPSSGTAAAAMPGAPAPTEPGPSVVPGADARIALVNQQVIEKTLKNQKAAGELVLLAEYERRAGEMGRQSRERVMSVIREVAERLGTETDPRKIVAILEPEIDRVFSDLAADIEQGALAADDIADAELEEEAQEEEAA